MFFILRLLLRGGDVGASILYVLVGTADTAMKKKTHKKKGGAVSNDTFAWLLPLHNGKSNKRHKRKGPR